MPIQLEISPRIIPSIASLYNDTNRIFMEYIDNSIDSAEHYYNELTNSYNRPIEITLKIIGNNYKSWQVIINDNCTGIVNFLKVVQSVWNSDKKTQPWTNWQFWYGIYSFMAACESLELTSKIDSEDQANSIFIGRSMFDKDKQQDVHFNDIKKLLEFDNHSSGTEVKLTGFDKDKWNLINVFELKKEIESHFELLLDRGNLKVELLDAEDNTYVCERFNYDQYEVDFDYIDEVRDLTYLKWRKFSKTESLTLDTPIKLFLKFTKKIINKPPVFVIKWRRIAEIRHIKAFKSNHKSDIWGHPNITWYIDLSDVLEPTIARDGFRNTNQSKAVFKLLLELEELIINDIVDMNKRSENEHYKTLEDKLNQVLSKLARIDSMNFRKQYLSGNQINLKEWWVWQSFDVGYWEKDYWSEKVNEWTDKFYGENEWFWIWPSWKIGNDVNQGWKWEGSSWSDQENDNPFEDSEFKWGEKKKSWFDIQFIEGDPPEDLNNKQIRSQLMGGSIHIYKEHPDFVARVKKKRSGEVQITQRLITYLAWEITVHYKDKLQTRNWQPEYNKSLFQDLVDFIYTFESMLVDLDWQSLSEVN